VSKPAIPFSSSLQAQAIEYVAVSERHRDLILAAYRHAVEQRYRFYSYGDCMLVV